MNDPPPPALPAEPDASHASRVLLTPTTMAALRTLARAWRLTRAEGAVLIGVSASTWGRFQAGTWHGTLSRDQLLRISAMIDMYRDLHLLFSDGMADRWVRLRNGGPLFAHMTPIGVMAVRGTEGVLDVRRYVDEMRQADRTASGKASGIASDRRRGSYRGSRNTTGPIAEPSIDC